MRGLDRTAPELARDIDRLAIAGYLADPGLAYLPTDDVPAVVARELRRFTAQMEAEPVAAAFAATLRARADEIDGGAT